MPKKQIDWCRCVIYKIYKDGVDDFYIGSTSNFIKRKFQHKLASKTSDTKIYKIIRDNGGWDEWIMTAIEEYKECENQIQARIREEEWRVKLIATMNTNKAYLSIEQKKEDKKEYYKINKEKINEQRKEQQKEYRKLNIDKKNEYREKNKDKIKAKCKEYYKINKEKINQQRKEQQKEYYQKNRDIILEKMKIKKNSN